ncbi:glutamate synthase (NADPH) large subunit [Tistlia consotensis]|uniref:Glutamate synthase [NADPH] large chain n=1 Tax=Tistlia consotensis USBA 355 TaxID=560819 RepID=A0A1Y6B5F9_9PROT|nr:glutamate synthase large subunit [Tistlia consotensis]SME93254.1 glutamate synthase (NADPH) large subunit [Tistlia consotensis USBA 355]SNR28524.1 glutamate synthase (NADPH) large subunit [Tistlia consotensis]
MSVIDRPFPPQGPTAAEQLAWQARESERLAREGLYDPAEEHDACGVGLVVSIDGKARREVVEKGIEALKAVWHRGAVDADGKTGDGAGIHVQIPQEFFREHVRRTGHDIDERRIGVGMVFLPRTDFAAQERCRVIVEREILNFGYTIYGWRQVPVAVDVIGEKANATRPEIEQIMIANSKGETARRFERDLYVIRRRIEKAAEQESIKDFYVCSLSGRSIIYKGMFLAEQLSTFYPDLLDERFVSNFAIFHQRYSTNTFPTWRLAQPFRVLAHNGEINTLKGNVNWMKAHECRLGSEWFGELTEDLKPVIQPGSSDSAALDAVFELLVRAQRDLPMVKTMLMPEAWSADSAMPQSWKDLYSYCNAVMEPWDGPAAICAYGGRWAVAGMDRNGLRPLRYTITDDGLLFAGSETGMVRLDEARIVEKGRVGPGEMIAVDLEEGRLYHDREIKEQLAASRPWSEWRREIKVIDDLIKPDAGEPVQFDREQLRRRQLTYGQSMEDLELILHPMVETAKEAVGSMGDDTPLAVLSERYRGLHHFFRQNFSQVTNPPIDSLREKRVMTLKTRLGNLGNILDEDEAQCRLLQLESPLLSNAEFDAMRAYMDRTAADIDCTFDPAEGDHALRDALARIRREAEDAVRGGREHVVLSDYGVDGGRAPIPMILAAAAVHTHLTQQKLRTFTSVNVRSGECLDVHYVAVLIGVGATTVNPYLAQESIADRHRRGLFGDLALEDCVQRYIGALDEGLLKIMSKMGISVISSYRGGYNFEAVGLSRTLVDEFFPGMPSRISGIGLTGIQQKLLELHERAWSESVIALPVGGFYRYRRGGEHHAWQAGLIHTLQAAVANDSYSTYKKFSEGMAKLPPSALRDLLDFKLEGRRTVSLDDVESITSIRKRFVTPGMSLGALSPEAHGTLNIAMNRIGAKSDSGEGGEDPARFKPKPNGDNENSAIKQVASGRFGVTAEYLNQCREIEIKVAQGAKPGEGGQLPAFKVTEMIAKLRHSTPGVMLISPPPHHDIYSIEDLAQLIYDLKQINPEARVCVKLVARSGIGTIAAGVAKAGADVILISGHVGGTGASPQTSIKFAGVPWEMGLSEVHQVLTLNRLRHRIKLRTDGGIRTGRDVVIAAMLGAEEYGVGTAGLVAMGCIMVRQCHSNTCPVGVCVQDEALRKRFTGTPEKVVNLFSFLAEEVREILAQLGLRSLDEVIGRTDLLRQVSRGAAHLDDLDLNPLLARAEGAGLPVHCTLEGRNEVPDTLDAQMLRDAEGLFRDREKMQLQYTIQNTQRAIGTRLSSMITRKFGMTGLAPGHLTARLRGSAGQSLGAWAVQGLKLEVFGDANDYVGKGLSGAIISVRPMTKSPLETQSNTIIGNTVLYGATAGRLFAAGQAGERFCVRNSGAVAVVEGCGSNGCEYMTGGAVVILGPIGFNFAAGMTGGMAFVYDPEEKLPLRINADSVLYQRVETDYWEGVLRDLVAEHVRETQSRFAERLLIDWAMERGHFWQIVPKEMVERLEQPISLAAREKRA